MKRSLKFLTAITLSLLLVFGSSLGAFAAKKTSIHLHADSKDYTVSAQLKGDFSSNGDYDEVLDETTVPMSGGSLYTSTDFSIDVSDYVLYFNIRDQNGNEAKWYVGPHVYEGKEGGGTINYWMVGMTVGTVIAHHWDENDNELVSNVEYSGYVGEPYSTSAIDIPDYQPKGVPTNANGTFIDGVIDVYYIYEPVPQGTIIVHYMYGETKLQADVELVGNVGEGYATESKSFEGYFLPSEPENAIGFYSDETIHVYYYYEANAAPQGTVIVHYMYGETKLQADVELVGNVGEGYVTESKSFEGYFLPSEPENAIGFYADETIHVYYYYEANTAPQGTVIVHYMYGETKLQADVELVGSVGEGYVTESKSFVGYFLPSEPENAIGFYADETSHVYYYYEANAVPQGTIIVHYMYGETKLQADVELVGSVGEGYVTESKSFDGFDLPSKPVNDTGSFTVETIHVYYMYVPTPVIVQVGSITVNKTITGDTPPSNSIFTFRLVGPAGETSTTRELSRTGAGTVTFEELTYGTYTLTEIGFPSNFSIVSGSDVQLNIHDETPNITANIINRYTEPTPPPPGPTPPPVEPTPERGTVRVHHIDINEFLLDPIFEFTGPLGTNYATAAREFEDLELVETPDNATGTFIDGVIDVFYVYSPGVEPLVILEVEEETPLAVPEVPDEEIVLTEPIPLAPLPQTGQLPAELFYGLGSVISMIGVVIRKGRKIS